MKINAPVSVGIPISIGELVDKLTILDIKLEMIKHPQKLEHIRHEKEFLENLYKKFFTLDDLREELYTVNKGLWHIEDNIRECERNKDFGAKFIRLARDVYYTNDKRFEIKNQINLLTNSDIKEVKSYESYS